MAYKALGSLFSLSSGWHYDTISGGLSALYSAYPMLTYKYYLNWKLK